MKHIRVVFTRDVTNRDLFGEIWRNYKPNEVVVPKGANGTLANCGLCASWIIPDGKPGYVLVYPDNCFEVVNTPEIDPEHIRQKVHDAFAFSLESFGFEHIVDHTENLTDEEKEWAKEHLDWQIVILDN